jgi:hypothetical protein
VRTNAALSSLRALAAHAATKSDISHSQPVTPVAIADVIRSELAAYVGIEILGSTPRRWPSAPVVVSATSNQHDRLAIQAWNGHFAGLP